MPRFQSTTVIGTPRIKHVLTDKRQWGQSESIAVKADVATLADVAFYDKNWCPLETVCGRYNLG